VMEHLRNGGSALCIFAPQGEDLHTALKEWGVQVRTDAVIVHEKIKAADSQNPDFLEEAKRMPFVFDIRDYGDHMLTRPLKSLASSLVPMVVVKTSEAKGYHPTQIIPMPANLPAWGDTDINALENGDLVKYDPAKNDVPGPVYAGAAVEADRGNRLVAIGSPLFIFDRFLNEPDPDLLKRGIFVARFPGNADLFMNSIFWLAKQETMIAISPSALEVDRIASMTPAAMAFWHWGVLIFGLPTLVILSGVWMYFVRRD
jgi:hypothetical protein